VYERFFTLPVVDLDGLLNGRNTTTGKEGIINLGKGLVLCNVLYVPNLSCDVIFVSQLIYDLSCAITFSDKLCVIQDHTSRTVIGLGEQQVELFHSLCGIDNKTTDHFDLIHCDVWGPYHVHSSCDDFSHVVEVYLLVEKSEVVNTLTLWWLLNLTEKLKL
ncbi:hypothetical protein CR513_35760, partial [Mucuna pruriens]